MTGSSFRLDGKIIPFKSGDTIINAALRAGEYIPHLCHHPEFTPHGSCRVCLVEVDGQWESSCTHPATEGAEVISASEAAQQQRRSLLEMLFVEGNHVCPGCEKSGACQLQAVAYYTGMLAPTYTAFFPRRTVDASHPDFIIDYNRCIVCELCVRASREVDGKHVFSTQNRGIHSALRVNTKSGRLGDSDFSKHDRAAQVCPVGAILPKHVGYDKPIGERLYDQLPIDQAGDQLGREEDKQ